MDQVFSAIVSTAQQMEVEQRMTKKSNQRKLAEERQQARSKKKGVLLGETAAAMATQQLSHQQQHIRLSHTKCKLMKVIAIMTQEQWNW